MNSEEKIELNKNELNEEDIYNKIYKSFLNEN